MEMKRIFTALVAIAMPLAVFAQAQINTKKVKLGDFPEKTMKVVLTGNPMIDGVLQDEISSGWRISPYEFCTLDDFEKCKTSGDWYFMLLSKAQFKDEAEPGIEFLTVVKGGAKAAEGIDNMLEVCSFPVMPAQNPSGREIEFLPLIIETVQGYIGKAMKDDRVAYAGLGKYAVGIQGTAGMRVVFADSDVSGNMPQSIREKAAAAGVEFVDADDADEILDAGEAGCVVSYTVAPDTPEFGSYCYKMLFGAGDHKLYYFKRQSVGRDGDCGFIASEINRVASVRKSGK